MKKWQAVVVLLGAIGVTNWAMWHMGKEAADHWYAHEECKALDGADVSGQATWFDPAAQRPQELSEPGPQVGKVPPAPANSWTWKKITSKYDPQPFWELFDDTSGALLALVSRDQLEGTWECVLEDQTVVSGFWDGADKAMIGCAAKVAEEQEWKKREAAAAGNR